MQKIFITGNLTADPELRSTSNGVSVCSFTIAVNRRFKDASGEQKTDFFRVNAWRGLGESCARYLSKGKKCAVIGEIQPRLYEDKKGTTRMSLDVQADEVEFLTPKSDSRDDSGYQPSEPSPSGFTDVDPGDIPF